MLQALFIIDPRFWKIHNGETLFIVALPESWIYNRERLEYSSLGESVLQVDSQQTCRLLGTLVGSLQFIGGGFRTKVGICSYYETFE
jgi:hypothetical protein